MTKNSLFNITLALAFFSWSSIEKEELKYNETLTTKNYKQTLVNKKAKVYTTAEKTNLRLTVRTPTREPPTMTKEM